MGYSSCIFSRFPAQRFNTQKDVSQPYEIDFCLSE